MVQAGEDRDTPKGVFADRVEDAKKQFKVSVLLPVAGLRLLAVVVVVVRCCYLVPAM